MGKKMFKIFLVQLFIVILVFSFFYYDNIYDKSALEDKLEITNKEERFKDLLTINTNIYEDLENALLNGKEDIAIKNSMKYKDPNEIFQILEKISHF